MTTTKTSTIRAAELKPGDEWIEHRHRVRMLHTMPHCTVPNAITLRVHDITSNEHYNLTLYKVNRRAVLPPTEPTP